MGDNYRLPRLDLRSGSARLTASGTFSKTAGNLDFAVAAPNLAEALPAAGGSLTAQGHVSGPWKTPYVNAQAAAQSLVYQTYSAASVKLQANVDLAANGPMQINLGAQNVGLNGQTYDTVNLTGQGTRQAHQLAWYWAFLKIGRLGGNETGRYAVGSSGRSAEDAGLYKKKQAAA